MIDINEEIYLYPERQDDGRILMQLRLGFSVLYEGSEGDKIRLLKLNTVECVTLLQRMSNTRERTITLDDEMEDYYRLKNETEKA